MRMNRFISIILLFLLSVSRALAWGKVGHDMVANLAYERLSNETQEAVKNILRKSDGSYGDDDGAGSPLASVANWADKVRFTKEYHWSTPLHYIDVQDSQISGGCPCEKPTENSTACAFDYARDCVEDICVAGAIANYTSHLHKLSSSPVAMESSLRGKLAQKKLLRESLMFLTHFVGDLHQPLHSSRASDMGGNAFHVHFDQKIRNGLLLRDGKRAHAWNLHSVWDDGIIERALSQLYNESRTCFEDDLRDLIKHAERSGEIKLWVACPDGRETVCVSLWAEESLEMALTWAYRNSDGSEVVNGSTLSADYYETRLEVVQQRIAIAGVRLAAALEIVLGRDRTVAVY